MYCLRLFLQELHCLLQCLPWLFCVFIEKHVYPKLHLDWFLFQRTTHPIVMYGLRLFIVALQEQQIVYMLLSSELWVPITSPSSVCLDLVVSEIAKCIA